MTIVSSFITRTNKHSATAESLLVWHMEIFVNAVC